MANVFDYLQWRGDLSFTQDPPNSVDALIFSSLVYLRFSGSIEAWPEEPMLLREAAEEFFELPDQDKRGRNQNDLKLLRAAADSARFGYTKLVHYRQQFLPEQDTQFAAMTFLLDDGSLMIAFRGTDNTLVGWKEDFNMSFLQTVPSQLLAVEYTREIYNNYVAPLRLCGHSKGGNLAVFAAARSSPMLQNWIMAVYNNDGPGFTDYMMGDPGYRAMVPRIRTFVPQSSIVGLLMEHEEPYTIIHSTQLSLLQHDTFSWEIRGKELVTVEEITEDSRFLNAAIKTWFNEMDNAQREQLVDTMFAMLSAGSVEEAIDIFQPRNLRQYIKILGSDEKSRNILSRELLGFLEAARRTRWMLEKTRMLHSETEVFRSLPAEDPQPEQPE